MVTAPNEYKIYFRNYSTDGDAFFIPVNPATISNSQSNANGDFNVLKIGPIVQPRTPELMKISFESYFPGSPNNMTTTGENFKPPEFYINFFQLAMQNKDILIFTQTRFTETNQPYFVEGGLNVIVSQFSYEERGGETGDFYYSIELTQYKDFSPQKIQFQNGSEKKEGGKVKATTEQTRDIPAGKIVVGKKMKINGKYYYDSFGAKPTGNGNGRVVVVARIVANDTTRAYPILVKTENGGVLGWCKKSDLQGV